MWRGEAQTKPQIVVPVVERIPVAVRAARVIHRIVPRTTPHHAVLSRHPTGRFLPRSKSMS